MIAPSLPEAADIPWQVDLSLAGNISAGTMKVVLFGPKFAKKKVNALIIRPSQSVNVHWLSNVDFVFFSFIHRGYSLLDAIEKTGEEKFQFHETLSFSLQNGLFSEYAFIS